MAIFSDHPSIMTLVIIIIIIMAISKCYFSREHIALSKKKWCEHRIRKNQQTKSTAHDGKSYLEKKGVNKPRQSMKKKHLQKSIEKESIVQTNSIR